MILGSNAVTTRGPDLPPARFTTQAQLAERQGFRKRMLWAVVLAMAGLLIFILLGPDAQSVKDKFEYYGAPDELNIMQEVSIDHGQDMVHQLPKSMIVYV